MSDVEDKKGEESFKLSHYTKYKYYFENGNS